MNRLAQVLFRFPEQTAEDFAEIHAQKRQFPEAGRGLGGQAFAGALDADDEDPFRGRQAVVLGLVGEDLAAFAEPGLEVFEAADIVQAFLHRKELKNLTFFNDTPFFQKDYFDRPLIN